MNSVLSYLSLYFISFYYLPEWVIQGIDRIHHAFFWKGTKDIHGGLYLINWQLICSHKNQGGGVCNLWLSTLLFYQGGGRDFFEIHTIHEWLLAYTTIIEDDNLLIYITHCSSMSSPLGEEFLRPPRLFFSKHQN